MARYADRANRSVCQYAGGLTPIATVCMATPARRRAKLFANTPAALLLLQRFAWQRLPGGAPSYDSNGRAYLRLYADDLDELKHSATAERLTWQAAPKAKPKE